MTREIRNTPHATPNPDGPHTAASSRGAGAGIRRPANAQEEPATDEPNYDSCMDDLNVILSAPLSEPDPVLKSLSSSDSMPRNSQDSVSLPSFLQERGKQPRTSEVFQSVGPRSVDVTEGTAGHCDVPVSSLTESSPDPESVLEGNPVASTQASLERTHQPRAVDWATDDDRAAESRVPWTLLLFMSYSSAVTLALTWVLWTGRSFRAAESSVPTTTQTEPESAPKTVDSIPASTLPPLPAENIAKLGETVRLGDLELTPLGIASTRLELVRSIEPANVRREKSPSLVLRLRFKNVSKEHAFAPLERRFVREQTGAVDRSSIVTSQGTGIGLFPLAVESEWSIVGQEFSSLEPGESMETIVVSAADRADLLTDEMTWRIRLRIGQYRTDVLGVSFRNSDVNR